MVYLMPMAMPKLLVYQALVDIQDIADCQDIAEPMDCLDTVDILAIQDQAFRVIAVHQAFRDSVATLAALDPPQALVQWYCRPLQALPHQ